MQISIEPDRVTCEFSYKLRKEASLQQIPMRGLSHEFFTSLRNEPVSRCDQLWTLQ